MAADVQGRVQRLDIVGAELAAHPGDPVAGARVVVVHRQIDPPAMGEGAVGDSLHRMGHRGVVHRVEEPRRPAASALVDLNRDREGREPDAARRRQMPRQLAVEIGEYIALDGLGDDVVAPLETFHMRHFEHRNPL